jgi:hypothetical protein
VVARVFARAADLPVRSRTRMFCALALGYFYYANKSAAAPFAALRRLVFSELARKHSTVGPSVLALAVFQAVLVLTLVDLSVRVAVLAFSVEEVIPVLTCSQLKRTRGARACECVHTFVALPVEVAAHAKTVCTMVGAPPLKRATNVAAVLPRWPPHADAF